jgi:hypothetical protein
MPSFVMVRLGAQEADVRRSRAPVLIKARQGSDDPATSEVDARTDFLIRSVGGHVLKL